MRKYLNKAFSLIGLTLALLLAVNAPAYGVDGVIEINQARADEGGVTATDAAFFPVTIDSSGSYRLTGNLTVPADTTAIEITTPDVTLDLNGFAIIGSGGTTGAGIFSSSTNSNTTVVNGTVTGIGDIGISLGGPARVERVRVISNGGTGIFISGGGGGAGSTVIGNTANGNGGSGILAGGGATVTGNTAINNAVVGIFAGIGSVVIGNTARDNGSFGIQTLAGCTVNYNTTTQNGGDGILVDVNGTVIGNISRQNTGFGLAFGSVDPNFQGGYVNNVLVNNAGGTVSGGIEMGTNVCNSNTTCP